MTKTWLDKICEPLEHPKYPQIEGSLVKYTYNESGEKGDIIGKCAEGEIACQNKISYETHAVELYEEDFINKLGVPIDIFNSLPQISFAGFHELVRFNYTMNLSDMIGTLNDGGHFKYPEMAEFLRTTFEDAV